jgi:hypothetical protein
MHVGRLSLGCGGVAPRKEFEDARDLTVSAFLPMPYAQKARKRLGLRQQV